MICRYTQLQYANQYAFIRMYTQFIYAIHNTQLPKISIRMIRKYLFPYASIRSGQFADGAGRRRAGSLSGAMMLRLGSGPEWH